MKKDAIKWVYDGINLKLISLTISNESGVIKIIFKAQKQVKLTIQATYGNVVTWSHSVLDTY